MFYCFVFTLSMIIFYYLFVCLFASNWSILLMQNKHLKEFSSNVQLIKKNSLVIFYYLPMVQHVLMPNTERNTFSLYPLSSTPKSCDWLVFLFFIQSQYAFFSHGRSQVRYFFHPRFISSVFFLIWRGKFTLVI